MKKIYLYCVAIHTGRGDVMGYALAEDGKCLASHLSSNEDFSKHDLGLNSDWKHDKYNSYYPDGFELEWVDDPDNHEGWKKAFHLNKLEWPENRYKSE